MGWKIEHTFVFYLLISRATATNILRTPKKNYAKFVLKHANKVHATAPYKSMTVRNLFICLDTCTYETSCKSANYKDTGREADQQNLCQLVANDRNDVPNYVDSIGWGHYDTGKTTLTKFLTLSYGLCVVPESYSCKGQGDDLITASGDKCNEDYAYFDFDVDAGRLYHHCSGHTVCIVSGRLTLDNCQKDKGVDYDRAFTRDWKDYLTIGMYCFNFGSSSAGQYIQQTSTCDSVHPYYRFQFPTAQEKKVLTTVFEGMSIFLSSSFSAITGSSRYVNNDYNRIGYSDDLTLLPGYKDYSAVRMETLFVAPSTGWYHFAVACNDQCVLYHGESASNNIQIIDRKVYGEFVSRLDYEKYVSQKSAGVHMEAGKEYYMQGLYREVDGENHMSVAMKKPGTDDRWEEVTSKYLKKYIP